MLVITRLGSGCRKIEVKVILGCKLEANLGYMRPISKKENKKKKKKKEEGRGRRKELSFIFVSWYVEVYWCASVCQQSRGWAILVNFLEEQAVEPSWKAGG